MIYPTTTLNNPYYFIRDNIVYDIKNTNDGDGCGEHKVIYNTESKALKKGENYTDINGNTVKAAADGSYDVSTGKINEAECAKIFPNLKVVYYRIIGDPDTMDSITSGDIDQANPINVYYWLQNRIKDGDNFYEETVGGDNGHGKGFFLFPGQLDAETSEYGHGGQTYLDCFYGELKEEIDKKIQNGATIESLKKTYPIYCFQPEQDSKKNVTTININGENVKALYGGVAYKSDDMPEDNTILNIDALWIDVYKVIDKDTQNYANTKLKPHGKKLNSGLTFVDKNKVTDL